MDGCADVGGCLELPFALMQLGKDGGKGGFMAILIIFGGIGLAVSTITKPKPPPPKPPITERVKDAFGHPINRWKIQRAEKKYHEEQLRKWTETVEAAEQAETAPIDTTNKPRIRDRIKDWMRDKLNEDHKKRHPEENK